MTKYYHYNTGRYALVDVFRRNIWLNIYDETIAHEIRRTFISKVGLIIYDLTAFENWSEQLVDSDSCLDWQVPVSFIEEHTTPGLVNTAFDDTIFVQGKPSLTNQTVKSLLSPERQKELQQQMLFYKLLLDSTRIHIPRKSKSYWWINDDIPTLTNNNHEILKNLRKIFATEIYLNEIEQQVLDLAQFYFSSNVLVSSKILQAMGRTYA
jgi:hypothetical protein